MSSSTKEIKVTFNTLTPLWTGDAWGDNREIRPSSIMGSLRFWFEVYCKSIGKSIGKLNINGVPSDVLDDYLKNYNKKNNVKETFQSLLLKEETKGYNYSDPLMNVLKKIQLPLPSIIFGCAGWKSQIKINNINYEKYRLKKSDINFSALYNKLENIKTQDSLFWANKLLFEDKEEIILFESVVISLLATNNMVFDELIKFLEFYKDKIIIVGGKKSFGFGFCKIETDLQLDKINLEKEKKKCFAYKRINVSNLNLATDKIVLGFNFKHYQRLKEQKKYRKINFGEQGKASNFFFSTKLKNQNEIYIVCFNGYLEEKFTNLLSKYSNFGGN